MGESNAPFITLGRHLKYLREQQQQSLAEVSGAVEIDEQNLERIESGLERPAEDILLLLISHYNLPEPEAMQLWESAEYDADLPDQLKPDIDPSAANKSVVMLLALDTRTLYSDGVEITATPAGLTLSFTQASGKPQRNSVARIGMSLEQAEQVAHILQQTIWKTKASKLLPPETKA